MNLFFRSHCHIWDPHRSQNQASGIYQSRHQWTEFNLTLLEIELNGCAFLNKVIYFSIIPTLMTMKRKWPRVFRSCLVLYFLILLKNHSGLARGLHPTGPLTSVISSMLLKPWCIEHVFRSNSKHSIFLIFCNDFHLYTPRPGTPLSPKADVTDFTWQFPFIYYPEPRFFYNYFFLFIYSHQKLCNVNIIQIVL